MPGIRFLPTSLAALANSFGLLYESMCIMRSKIKEKLTFSSFFSLATHVLSVERSKAVLFKENDELL
jgi:hypothetical protein